MEPAALGRYSGSMSQENLEIQLQRLAQAKGLPDLRLDADGHCMVRIDDQLDLTFQFEEDSQSLVLSVCCGKLPATRRERVLHALLDANFYWSGSGGATLSTNSAEGTVYLQLREPTAQLDADRLEDLLQALILNGEIWVARLARLSGRGSQDSGLQVQATPHFTDQFHLRA
ncbi:MAG: type III secretion system chaperone [Ramlibacter sp.]|nr:type III secretion system chaperone [Ramlibacter sp.]